MKTTLEHKQLIDQYITQNDQEAAAKLLFEPITKCAREKNFPEAEALTTKLYEAAPLALNEIVKAGEAILKALSTGDVANVTSFVSKRQDHRSKSFALWGGFRSCGFPNPTG